MAVPWNAAIEEAYASCPPSVLIYDTLELQHPAIQNDAEEEVPARIVNDVRQQSFGIEAGATFDAGDTVAFSPGAFGAAFPTYQEGQVPSCEITIDNVDRGFTAALEAAMEYDAHLVAIFRQYTSEDTSEPAYGPIPFIIKRVKVTATTITGTAQVSVLYDKKFPSLVYTRAAFPGLIR